VLDAGRIVVEERISVPRGQRTGIATALRERLLGSLGVEQDEPLPFVKAE
jgi:sulfonate transport system ATP-binding protein